MHLHNEWMVWLGKNVFLQFCALQLLQIYDLIFPYYLHCIHNAIFILDEIDFPEGSFSNYFHNLKILKCAFFECWSWKYRAWPLFENFFFFFFKIDVKFWRNLRSACSKWIFVLKSRVPNWIWARYGLFIFSFDLLGRLFPN